MIKYILFILFITSLAYSTSCKKVYPESPLQFDSLDQSGGNLARFTILGNYLLTVNDSIIKVYNVQNPATPVFAGNVILNAPILSLRTYKDSLLIIGTFMGAYSQYTLNVYSFKNAASVRLLGTLYLCQAYDPFTNKGSYLLTLQRAGGGPSYFVLNSALNVFDTKNLGPAKYTIQNDIYSPSDLTVNGNNLFVCDSGLKVFDVTDISKITLSHHFNIDAQNILDNNGNVTILGTTGLFQYQYVNDTLKLLSKINIAH